MFLRGMKYLLFLAAYHIYFCNILDEKGKFQCVSGIKKYVNNITVLCTLKIRIHYH